MSTHFMLHSPQKGYTATVTLTCSKNELSALYNVLKRAETSTREELRIQMDVLAELQRAHGWLVDMESISATLKD